MIIKTSWSSRYILIINVIIMRIRKKSRIIMRMKMKMRIKGEIGKLRWIWWCGVVGGVWQKCYREPIFPPLRIWWMGTFRSGRGAPATTLGRHHFILVDTSLLTYLLHIHFKSQAKQIFSNLNINIGWVLRSLDVNEAATLWWGFFVDCHFSGAP